MYVRACSMYVRRGVGRSCVARRSAVGSRRPIGRLMAAIVGCLSDLVGSRWCLSVVCRCLSDLVERRVSSVARRVRQCLVGRQSVVSRILSVASRSPVGRLRVGGDVRLPPKILEVPSK